MTAFAFTDLVNDPPAKVISAALGVNPAGKFVQADVGKAVKMAANNNYVLCVQGDEIEGFVSSVEPFTVNDGFGFGGVQVDRRKIVEVGVNTSGSLVVGDLVVADAQSAVGTAGTPKVIKGTAASQLAVANYDYTERTPNTFLWTVIRLIGGTGAAGDSVLIELV